LHRLGLLQLVFRALLGFSRLCGRKRRLEYCKGNNAGAKDRYRPDQTPDLWFSLDHRVSFTGQAFLQKFTLSARVPPPKIPDLERLPVLLGRCRNSPVSPGLEHILVVRKMFRNTLDTISASCYAFAAFEMD
jgi:hypothetical protein